MTRRFRLPLSARRALGVLSMLVLLSGGMAAAALADDPPPATTVVVTVTTPVTAPPPDPAPTPVKPKPVQKPHVQAPPKVTPKPASPTPAPSTASTTRSSVFRPPAVTAPKTSTRSHVRKGPAATRNVHKVKTVAPKPVAPKPKAKAKPKPVANPVAPPASTKPVKSAVPVSAAAKRGGLTGGLRLALFSIVAALLLAVTAVVEVNRRRRRPLAVSEFVATPEAPVVERPAELPVVERPSEVLPPAVIAVEPVVSPIVESQDQAEAPLEDDFVDLPVYDDRCEITAWRGYAKWRFYGRIDTADGEVALVESRPFRAPGSAGPEPTPAAEAAHSELTARLESEGWVRVDGGAQWFELTFVRRESQEAAVPVGSPGVPERLTQSSETS